MLANKSGFKSAQSRFSLLLLEDGEFFLDDFSVHRFLDPVPVAHRFFFEPQDLALPVLRFPLRAMATLPIAEIFDQPAGDCAVYLAFTCATVVAMKERGVDHPYIYTTPSSSTASKVVFALLHSRLEDFLARVEPLYALAHRQSVLNRVDEERLLAPVLAPRRTDAFDASLLVDFRERPLLPKGKIVDRIGPLLTFPGCVMLTNQRLYFQPAPINNVGDPVLNWAYETIEYLYKRRHMLKQTGLEIFLQNGDSFFFSCASRRDRDALYSMMVAQPALMRLVEADADATMLLKWQTRDVSNFEYLRYLNNAAGRTLNDLTQYPVYPWIIADYTSPTLDLTDPQTFRDLQKPIGALNADRLAFFKRRLDAMPRGDEAEGLPPPFLYGTHYSTPGYVLYYLVRMAPEYMLCLQNGKFDAPDRLFQSVEKTFASCLTNHADLKELIPAFYDSEAFHATDWLLNGRNLDLGTTQTHTRVSDVVLPPWASSPFDFVKKNREALESDFVSQHLHHWIDLIFGFKQQGDAALAANNLFYYLSYEGSVDLETITDPVEKCSFEAQIQEFGQTPKLLFTSPHPARNDVGRKVQSAPPTPPATVTPPIAPVLSPRTRHASDPLLTAAAATATSVTTSTSLSSTNSSSTNSTNSSSMNITTTTTTTDDPYALAHDDDDISSSSSSAYARKSMFGFRGRSIGVPLQAQRLVGGLTAQFRRRLSTETLPLRRWGWTFSSSSKKQPTSTDAPFWAGSSPYKLHSSEVTSLVLARDGRALFSTAHDTTFKVSATLDGSLRRNLSCSLALSCCDVSLDEKLVFIGSWDNCLYMYSVDVGRVIAHVTAAHDDRLSGVCVLGDDRVLTSSLDGALKLWHFTPSGLTPAPLATFLECDEPIVQLSVSADGAVAAAGTRSGVVFLVDLRANELLRKLVASPMLRSDVTGVTFCGGSTTLACVTAKNELSLFTSDGNRLAAIDVKSDGAIRCLESDGEFAIGGTSSGKLLVWKLDEPAGKELVFQISNAHAVAVSALAVSANGATLVSAAVDGSIRIWRLKRKTAARGRLPGFFS